MMIAFGPVPSRRLGRSLGINNIPPKTCTYSCAYCQLGRTQTMQVDRSSFFQPAEVFHDVALKVAGAKAAGETIDFLAFVADGEPTMEDHLGEEIDLLRELGIKIAVITNASLIWRADVRKDLAKADWVSLKVDAVDETIWRRIDRPHKGLHLDSILDGMLQFADGYGGTLATETMLVRDLNDGEEHLRAVAEHIGRIQPSTAYLSIATRPPAERWVKHPREETIHRAYQIFRRQIDRVEYLIGYEGDSFAFTGNAREDLLSITSVHPMRREAVDEFLARAGESEAVVEQLVSEELWIPLQHDGHTFYMRRLDRREF